MSETEKPKQSQSERFKQAARELGCDESEERFNEALKAVAKHKPQAELNAPEAKSTKSAARRSESSKA